MSRAAWCALAVLLSLPLASAGTESDPEVTDRADQGAASVDLLAAWVDNEPDGLRFTVKVRGFVGSPASHAWGIGFTVAGGERHVAVVATDTTGRIGSIVDRVGFGSRFGGVEEWPDNLEDARIVPGSPAYVTARIPWGAVPDFEPGRIMTVLYGITDDVRSPKNGRDHVDIGESGRWFTLAGTTTAPTREVAALPVIAASALLCGGIGAVIYGRTRRGRAPP